METNLRKNVQFKDQVKPFTKKKDTIIESQHEVSKEQNLIRKLFGIFGNSSQTGQNNQPNNLEGSFNADKKLPFQQNNNKKIRQQNEDRQRKHAVSTYQITRGNDLLTEMKQIEEIDKSSADFKKKKPIFETMTNSQNKISKIPKLKKQVEEIFSFKEENTPKQNKIQARLLDFVLSEKDNHMNSTKSLHSTKNMKLKDYLFMVQTTAKIKSQKNSRSFVESSSYTQSNKKQNVGSQEVQKVNKKNKFKVTNAEMYEIVKKQIKDSLINQSKKINQLMQVLDQNLLLSQSGDPSNEEMIELYNLRNGVKEKIDKPLTQVTVDLSMKNEMLYNLFNQKDLPMSSESVDILMSLCSGRFCQKQKQPKIIRQQDVTTFLSGKYK